MITYIKGNIFESKADVLVNPVNTVGIMGAGLAKQFKDQFPNMYEAYKMLCKIGVVETGSIVWFNGSDRTIANLPTKRHWKNPSKLEWISEGLNALHNDMYRGGYTSVALPKLGCGLGGLKWEVVKDLIELEFDDDPDIMVEVYV